MVQAMAGGEAAMLAYRTLSAMLDRGVFPPGSRLPGERNLAREVKVSRATLRLALERLADHGRLVASPQRGWFVPQILVGEPPNLLLSFSELARSRGLHATSEVLTNRVRRASFAEAEDLLIAAAAPVVELVRLRSMDGVPITLETAVLPLHRVEWLVTADLRDQSLYELLADHGHIVHRSAYTVQAMNAGDHEAGPLDLPVGAAVLVAHDVTFTVDRIAIMSTVNYYRGDAYRFTADLFRRAE